MKILFFNNNLSGLLQFRTDVIRHFIENNCEVVLVSPPNKDIEYKLPQEVHFLPLVFDRTSTSLTGDLKLFVSFLKILRQEKPNIVFNYTIKPNIYGAVAAKLLGIPNVCMIAGLGYTFTNNSLSSRFARLLYKIGLGCTNYVMLLNEFDVKQVKSLKLCHEAKLIHLKGGEGVNLNAYPFNDNTANEDIFLFIGRLIEEKGYTYFSDAAKIVKKKYPFSKFWVLGNIDLLYPKAIAKERLEKDVQDEVIEYLGATNYIQEYFAKPGIVVCIPSFYSEGLNRSLMEGCSSGKPIITCDNKGCRETCIDGFNGFLVPAKNTEALAEAMIKYIELPVQKKKEYSENSRKLAQECFDVNDVLKVYDEIVHKSLNSN